MYIHAYLVFNGACEEAFNTYAKVLRGRIAMLSRFGEGPGSEEFSSADKNKVMHARLEVDDQILMASDNHPSYPYDGIKGCSISLHVDTPEEADRISNELSQGGSVQMPPQETFWARRFAMLTDRFGVPWMVNCPRPEFAAA